MNRTIARAFVGYRIGTATVMIAATKKRGQLESNRGAMGEASFAQLVVESMAVPVMNFRRILTAAPSAAKCADHSMSAARLFRY